MIASLNDLLTEARSGTLTEHRHPNVSLKESWRREHGASVSYLANRPDGPAWLAVGVADDGALKGWTESKARSEEQLVSQHFNEFLDPSLACRGLQCKQLGSSWILVAELYNPGAVVFWDGKAYKSAGTTKEVMTPEEIMALTVRLPGLADYSAQPWSGVIDPALASDYLARVREYSNRTLSPTEVAESLLALGISSSKVGSILFGDSRYRFVRYDVHGKPVSNEVDGPIGKILLRKFRDGIQAHAQSLLGSQIGPYPDEALAEALANAVAHAAYFESGGDLAVECFVDRVCISNLCVEDSVAFANLWFSRARRTLNRKLMEALRLAHLADELGRGKNVIFGESIAQGKIPPRVEIESAGRLRRWRLSLFGGTTDERLEKLLSQLLRHYGNDRQKALLAHALVLWRDEPLKSILKHVDQHNARVVLRILEDEGAPVGLPKGSEYLVAVEELDGGARTLHLRAS